MVIETDRDLYDLYMKRGREAEERGDYERAYRNYKRALITSKQAGKPGHTYAIAWAALFHLVMEASEIDHGTVKVIGPFKYNKEGNFCSD